MAILVLALVTAFLLTYFALPTIIQIARTRRLHTATDARGYERVMISPLGGIGIFAGTIFSILLWTPFVDFNKLQYILCALTILFLVAARDDLSAVSVGKKLAAQLMAGLILVCKSDIRLHGLEFLSGIGNVVSEGVEIAISLFVILLITNAFNLIDGINGLAASLGALATGVWGVWFFLADHTAYATIAIALLGSMLAFLKYNMHPARIHMGDSGSLVLGIICAILAVEFIEVNAKLDYKSQQALSGAPAVAIAVLFVPLLDTLRVAILRLYAGANLLEADRRHIHHLLFDAGYSHDQITTGLVGFTILLVSMILGLDGVWGLYGNLLLEVFVVAGVLYWLGEQKSKTANATS
jgi:UDP-N-acetylmuramyl pentapeptide phosphotransferase/UDP-N-acetylglucosamine-1-phosphate transferase